MDRFDPQEFLRLVDVHRITSVHLVPTMFTRLLRLDDETRRRYDLSSLRCVVHAAAPCPVDVKRAVMEWFGPIVTEYYGSTETGMVAGCDSSEWLAHPGTVGRALPSCRIAIRGPHGALGPGEVGEVYVRAESMSDFTYHGREEDRTDVEWEGLIGLGDVGYVDDDGYLFLTDRSHDVVIIGGVNVYPVEVEALLHTLPHVVDCAVFGIPDPDLGEVLAAVIQVDEGVEPTAEEIREHLRDSLGSLKVPRHIEFRATLPRDDSGKIYKRLLREPFWPTGRSI
jgi:long-chain acyl-CoA synthetase